MNDSKISLLIEYARKEAELNREYDKEDGIDVNSEEYELNYDTTKKRIETFIMYKEIRTKQYWYSLKFKDSNIKDYAIGRNELDRQRRFLHNSALQSIIGFDKFSDRFDLPKIYEGNLLTSEEIEKHEPKSYDKRMEMTDFLLGLLNEIENFDVNKEIEQNDQEYSNFISTLKSDVEKVDRDYAVEKTLIRDDGNIKFTYSPNDERF